MSSEYLNPKINKIIKDQDDLGGISIPSLNEGDRIFVKTSSIEFYQNYQPDNYSNNNFFDNVEPINLDEFQNNEIFDFEPFKLSNTIGLQRVIVPE